MFFLSAAIGFSNVYAHPPKKARSLKGEMYIPCDCPVPNNFSAFRHTLNNPRTASNNENFALFFF